MLAPTAAPVKPSTTAAQHAAGWFIYEVGGRIEACDSLIQRRGYMAALNADSDCQTAGYLAKVATR